jgi:hypothetical protein
MNKIKVNEKKMIETLIIMEDENYKYSYNGYHGVHIMPASYQAKETDILNGDIEFYQSGNSYPPDAPDICEWSVDEFFDYDAILKETDFDFNDSKSNAEEYNLRTEEEIQNAIDEHINFAKEVCHSHKNKTLKHSNDSIYNPKEYEFEIVWE